MLLTATTIPFLNISCAPNLDLSRFSIYPEHHSSAAKRSRISKPTAVCKDGELAIDHTTQVTPPKPTSYCDLAYATRIIVNKEVSDMVPTEYTGGNHMNFQLTYFSALVN